MIIFFIKKLKNIYVLIILIFLINYTHIYPSESNSSREIKTPSLHEIFVDVNYSDYEIPSGQIIKCEC